jgi:hypothetical protein
MNLLSKGFPKLHSCELKIRGYFFKKRLARVARFLRKHALFSHHPIIGLPSRELLDIWEREPWK